jgi:hypothetical protein
MLERNHYENNIPNNINIYCNTCDIDVSGKLTISTYKKESIKDDNQQFGNREMEDVGVYRCPNCGDYVSVYFKRIGNNYSDSIHFYRNQSYPNNLNVWKFEYVKNDVKKNLMDIYKIYNCKVYDSAIISARALLQKIVREIGKDIFKPEDNDLRKEINRLFSNNLITKELKNVAHQIRITGNEYAHPEEINENFSRQDADNIIKLLENFILLLVEIPSELKIIIENQTK